MTDNWYVYLLRCNDNTLYTGITTNIERRIKEHNLCDKKGAKYTRARRPVTLVYTEESLNRSTASQREYALKKLTKKAKESLIKTSLLL